MSCLEGLDDARSTAALEQARQIYGDGGACDTNAETRKGCDDACTQAVAALGDRCGDEKPKSSASNDGLTLTVFAGSEADQVGGIRVNLPKFYAVYEIALTNNASDSLAVSSSLFRANTNGLEIAASPLTSTLDRGCLDSGFLATSSTLQCEIAFEVTARPSEIVFSSVFDATSRSARVSTAVTDAWNACTRCDGPCADLQSDDAHCGACGNSVTESGRVCVAGRASCAEAANWCPTMMMCISQDRWDASTERQCVQQKTGFDVSRTCRDICAPLGCASNSTETTYLFAKYESGLVFGLGCDEAPEETREGSAYESTQCACY